MKIQYEVDVDERTLVPLCTPADVATLWAAINAITRTVFIEGHYDPYNEATLKMAMQLEPHLDAITAIMLPTRPRLTPPRVSIITTKEGG